MDWQVLGLAENNMLFSSPKVRLEKAVLGIDRQDSQKVAIDSLPEEIASTLSLNGLRGISKFWQTPGEHQISPFTPVEE